MGLITSAGIGSGIDVEAIIGAILNAERSPKEASLTRNENRVESTLSALGQLSSALSKLDTALDDLNSLSDFKIRSATSSDTEFLSATATTEASSGSFSIVVNSLAQGSRHESTAGTFSSITDTVGSGTLTLTAGSNTFDVVVGATDTLDDIRNAINDASDNFGVNVNIINGASGTDPILVFSSSITGDSNTLSISNNDVSLDSISTSLTATETASGATATIDGISVTSDTNVFVNAIQDTTFTILKETEIGSPIILDIAIDKEAAKTTITSFVEAVTEFQSLSQQLSLSSATAVGALAGDVTLRLLNKQLTTTLQDTVSGLTSNFHSLNSLGISFNSTGQLEIDEDALDAVLESNFDDIANVFASTNGVSLKLQSVIDTYYGSGSIISVRETSLKNQQRRLETDRLNFDYRMEQLETQLRNKFGAMDGLVAQLNNTGQFLAQQLENLPGFGSDN